MGNPESLQERRASTGAAMTQYNVNVSCWGKKAFITWSAAAAVIKRHHKRIRKADDLRKDGEGIYRCRICHHFHVGGGRERD